MKIRSILGFITVILLVNCAATVLQSADDLIKMARSGVDEEVLDTYINVAPDTFSLSADDIVTLRDLGVSSKVINDALRHGRVYGSDSAYQATAAQPAPAESAGVEPSIEPATAVVAPPPADMNISFFYQALYPYGNWLLVDGQWCWQPNARFLNPDWAPYYRHGRWVWSDWGWCWASDYSWGWAPFHYGRWFRHRTHGWCWVPDNEWGPAWVTWRWGDEFCGWAPLPPAARFEEGRGFYFGGSIVADDFGFSLGADDYFFVPAEHFCDRHPWVHAVPSVRRADIFRRTGPVRGAFGFEHDHFFNRGVPVEDVARMSKRSLTPVSIESDELRPGQEIRRGAVEKDRFMIYRPRLAPTAPRTPPVIGSIIQKEHPVIGSIVPAASSVPKTARSGNFIQRQKNAMQQTLKVQKTTAENAAQEQYHLEQAARYEADAGKQAALRSEAEIQAEKARQAQEHVSRIRQWSPPDGKRPLPMARSRIAAPQDQPQNQERMNRELRSQIYREAQIEGQRQQAMENMIRNSPRNPAPARPDGPEEKRKR